MGFDEILLKFWQLAFDWRYAPILASCNRTMQAKNHPPLWFIFMSSIILLYCLCSFNVVFALLVSSFLFWCRLFFFDVVFAVFMSSLLFLCRLCYFMSSLLMILVVFVLFNWLRHLHKTGNGIMNMWPNFLVSWSVVNWPSEGKDVFNYLII